MRSLRILVSRSHKLSQKYLNADTMTISWKVPASVRERMDTKNGIWKYFHFSTRADTLTLPMGTILLTYNKSIIIGYNPVLATYVSVYTIVKFYWVKNALPVYRLAEFKLRGDKITSSVSSHKIIKSRDAIYCARIRTFLSAPCVIDFDLQCISCV